MDAKLVLVGPQNAGKTAVVTAYVHGVFTANLASTVGAAFFTKRINVDRVGIKLQIWDTAGQERFRAITPMYYRGADAVLLVYDVGDAASFASLRGWLADVKRNAPEVAALFIVGNKADKDVSRVVPDADAAAFARDAGAEHLLVSARDMIGLDELFLAVGHALIKRKRAAGVPVPTGGFALTDGPDVRAEARTPPPAAGATSSCC